MSFANVATLRQTLVDWALYAEELFKSGTTAAQATARKIFSEGRNAYTSPSGQKYSWCGDFATYILSFAGADQKLQNRTSVRGVWTPGVNISMLIARARELGAYRANVGLVEPGDPVIIDRPNGGHIDIAIAKAVGTSVDVIGGNIADRVARATRQSAEIICVFDAVQLTSKCVRGPSFTNALDGLTGLPVIPQTYDAKPALALPMPSLGKPELYPGYPIPTIDDLTAILAPGVVDVPTLPPIPGLPPELGSVVDLATQLANTLGVPAMFAPTDLPSVVPPQWAPVLAFLSPLLLRTRFDNGGEDD